MSIEGTYYLVEDFDPNLDHCDAEVVSITPWASYQLEKAGIKYRILEDFYSAHELIKDQDNFVLEELECYDRLDKYLKDSIGFCKEVDISPVRIHHSRFTYLTNTIIIQSYMITHFISKASPKRIIYVCKAGKENKTEFSVYSFQSKALRNMLYIIKSYCAQRQDIVFEVKEFQLRKPDTLQTSETKPFDKIRNLFSQIGFRDILKSIFHIFKYAKLSRYLLPGNKLRFVRILFLNAGGKRMDYLVRKFIQNKASVFIKDGNNVFLASSLSGRRLNCFQKEESDLDSLRKDCKDASLKIDSQTDFYKWINAKCGFDVKNIIAPYMEDFVRNVCVEFLGETIKFIDFCKKEKIDFIVSNASVGKNVTAPLTAGKSVKDTKNICFQHACIVLDLKTRYICDELDAFDYYFTADNLSEHYFRHYSKSNYINGCVIRQYPHYFKNIISRKPRIKKRRKREKVFYVTKKLAQGRMRFKSDGGIIFPLAYYYEFQKHVIEIFGKRNEFDFIYKHAPAQKWADASIIPHIKERNFKNISIETKHFVECLRFADRVILDYPSTGFFEAARAGIPVMSLYSELSEIWSPYKKYFGKSLQEFSTIGDAINKIDMFLNDEPGDYICDLPLSNEEILEDLLEIKRSG